MKQLRFHILLIACGMIALAPAPLARAQGEKAYLRLDGGVNFAENPSLLIDGTPGKLRLDTGYRADLALGYDLNRWVGVEIQAGFLDNSAESVTQADRTQHFSNTWLRGIPLMANVRFHYENRTDFVPYLGGGAGGLVSMLSINDHTDTQAIFAYELTAGLIYKIDERAWIDAGYKYLAAEDADFTLGTAKVSASKLRNHFVGVSVIWRF